MLARGGRGGGWVALRWLKVRVDCERSSVVRRACYGAAVQQTEQDLARAVVLRQGDKFNLVAMEHFFRTWVLARGTTVGLCQDKYEGL